MDYDITHLTFVDDPTTYQPSADEVCARVPVGIASEEDLVDILREDLGFSTYRVINWAHTLREALRFWSDWRTTPRRTVILHNDLPFLWSSKNGWYTLQIYLKVLIDSIVFLQAEDATVTDLTKQRELVAIFPAKMYEELHAALYHPPVWRASVGFPEYEIDGEFDASWPTVLQYLHYLDGLTAHICTLGREDVGYMDVYYRRETDTYFVEHYLQGLDQEKMASVEKNPSAFTGLSFDQASQLMETFFAHGELSASVYWLDIHEVNYHDLEAMRGPHYYRSNEEELLESYKGMVHSTIEEGMLEARIESGERVFSLDYWKDVLIERDTPLSRRLTAMCIIGLSELPEAPELLRPLLQSTEKRERWVSARFCGMWHEEEVLPVLLSMLTDELPLKRPEEMEYDSWYDNWRPYAFHLLRQWSSPEVRKHLRLALAVWVQAEPLIDPAFVVWKYNERELCYELGYQGEISALKDLPDESVQQENLDFFIKKGAIARRKQMTAKEEDDYRKHWDFRPDM